MSLDLSPTDLFALTGPPVLLGWAIVIFCPRRFAWLNAIAMWIIPMGLSALYAVLVLTHFNIPGGGYGTLEEVATLLASDWGLLAGWVHFLAFDLFVGALMAQRMDKAGIDRLIQAPVLVSIFMFGPLGFLIAGATEFVLRARALLPKPKQENAHGLA